MLRRKALIAAVGATLAVCALAAAPARANGHVGFSVSVGGPGYAVNVGNAPYYGAPYYGGAYVAPTYYPPAYAPDCAPAYAPAYAPAPAYVAPPVAYGGAVVVAAPYRYYGRPYYGHVHYYHGHHH